MSIDELAAAERLLSRLLVRDVMALRLSAEAAAGTALLVADNVRRLRAAGVSWYIIADALDIPRRTAMRRYSAGVSE